MTAHSAIVCFLAHPIMAITGREEIEQLVPSEVRSGTVSCRWSSLRATVSIWTVVRASCFTQVAHLLHNDHGCSVNPLAANSLPHEPAQGAWLMHLLPLGTRDDCQYLSTSFVKLSGTKRDRVVSHLLDPCSFHTHSWQPDQDDQQGATHAPQNCLTRPSQPLDHMVSQV